ncbi:hypothetical protein [Nocardioides ultimimeridianus]
MTDWHALRDAYGSAGAVPDLLDRAEVGGDEVWGELWSRLCHQGTVYPASYAALPRLAALAEAGEPAGRVEPLLLAGSIIASTDGQATTAVDVRTEYADAIDVLHDIAERAVPRAGDDTDFLFRVQALTALEGGSTWGHRLEALAAQEVELACRRCGEQLLIDLEDSPAVVRGFDDASIGTRTLSPADPSRLSASEARAYELATAHGRTQVAGWMLELFGWFECPGCGFRDRASAAPA